MTQLTPTGISAPKPEPMPAPTPPAPVSRSPTKRLVVVTGASTGIGYATTQALIARGYPVSGHSAPSRRRGPSPRRTR